MKSACDLSLSAVDLISLITLVYCETTESGTESSKQIGEIMRREIAMNATDQANLASLRSSNGSQRPDWI